VVVGRAARCARLRRSSGRFRRHRARHTTDEDDDIHARSYVICDNNCPGEHSASQARSKVLFPSEARPRALTSGQLDRRRHVDAAAHPGLDVPWQIGFNVLVHGGGCSSGMELGLIQLHRRLRELEVRAHCVSATRRVFTDSFVRNSASYHVSRPFEYVFPQRLIATHATNVAVSQLGQYRCAVTTAGPRDSRPAQRRRCAVGVAAQTREPAAATWIPLCEIQKMDYARFH
jgi:hypothetical protein